MWYYITAVIGAAIGFGTFALLAINGENKEIRRLRKALRKIKALDANTNAASLEADYDVIMDTAEQSLKRN